MPSHGVHTVVYNSTPSPSIQAIKCEVRGKRQCDVRTYPSSMTPRPVPEAPSVCADYLRFVARF